MTRLLTFVTVILAIISLASAQVVDTLNTPLGPVKQGANVLVSWTLVNGVDATGKTGDLSATDSASKNVIEIAKGIQLAPKSYTWNVQVAPGTYTLGLNDGSGLKQSGEVVVNAGDTPSSSGGASGGTPGTTGAPASSSSAAAPDGTTTPGAVTTGTSGSGSGSGSGTAGSGSGGSGSTSAAGGAGGGAETPSTISTPSPKPTSSASLIFSGYEVVFSLLVIAIAMVQF